MSMLRSCAAAQSRPFLMCRGRSGIRRRITRRHNSRYSLSAGQSALSRGDTRSAQYFPAELALTWVGVNYARISLPARGRIIAVAT